MATNSGTARPLRAIRSFVRREGRITRAQRRALESLAAGHCICAQDSLLDLQSQFGRYAECHLEIGCGAGDALIALARQHPEHDYLGSEVYRPGVGSLLRRLASEGLSNVRILCTDVVVALEHQLPARSLDAVYLFFPDPWPKKRHHKRRLIQPGFAELLHARLKTHGRVFIATDWDDYAHHILQVMESHGFTNLAGPGHFAPRPRWRPTTRYEHRAFRLGHEVRDFVFAPS